MSKLTDLIDSKGRPKVAPVQGYSPGIPWSLHLEAYDAYRKKWGGQEAMIDLEGKGCRGGFSTGELDSFIPGWRDKVSELAILRAELSEAKEKVAELTRSGLALMGDLKKVKDDHAVVLEDVYSALLWLHRRLPAVYTPLVTIDQTIESVGRSIGYDAREAIAEKSDQDEARDEQVGSNLVLAEDLKALMRFAECAEDFDSGGHDVSKECMARLCEIGVMQTKGFGRHQITSFGDYVLSLAAGEPATVPLQTYADRCPAT